MACIEVMPAKLCGHDVRVPAHSDADCPVFVFNKDVPLYCDECERKAADLAVAEEI